jgi:multiple sugar transport system permease protein
MQHLDGASAWQAARQMTLPLLSLTVLCMVVLAVIHSAQWTVPLVNVQTGGSQQNATTNVHHLLCQFGFQNFDVGVGSAAAVLFFHALGLVAWLFSRLTDRYWFYDA